MSLIYNPLIISKKMRRVLHLFSMLLILAGVSCSSPVSVDSRQTIMVSILPQKYLAERITGDRFRIEVLVPPGASAETYEPTPRQIQDVANSKLYFGIGYMEFENTIVRNLRAQNTGVRFINTAEGVDLIAAEIVDHGDHAHLFGVDPHIWLSVSEVKVQVENMLEAVIDADPGNSSYYRENFLEFSRELDELHAGFINKFSDVKRRTFLIFHPALGYFSRDYDLNQVSIEDEGKSPTAANMRRVVDIARSEGIKDVLIQMEFERESARAVARELGGDIVRIDPLAENWMENISAIAETLYEILNND
jgi:zinc transport system substrate-binding protein